MTGLLDKLPTILVLAVLVGIFLSLRKHSASARANLWVFAWGLILLHFFVQVFETKSGAFAQLFRAIDLGSLEISGIVFVVSLTVAAEDRFRRYLLLVLLAIPTAFHATAIMYGVHLRWALAGALGMVFFGGAACLLVFPPKRTWFHIGTATLLVAEGVWAVREQLHGNALIGIIAILTIAFGLPGILYWQRFKRISPGVITVTLGFLCWGGVFPVASLLGHYYPSLQMNPDLWNVPKYFVAFGMILSLVEDKSHFIEATSAREHAEYTLLQVFARITSDLLKGKEPASLSGEIASAITDAAKFPRAAILLVREDHSILLAGASGFSPAERTTLADQVDQCTAETIRQLCGKAQPLGHRSYLLPDQSRPNQTGRLAAVSPASSAGLVEILIPLVSTRESSLGCILLLAPEEAAASSPELVKIEMLAADLAVTIENRRLHRQLVQSEKLAGLGQLVAGVAHELNNPLTGIIGYTDLLSDEVREEAALKRLSKLGQEARRMKRIVDGLLRFSRQSSSSRPDASLEVALRDIVQLREYYLRTRNIEIDLEIEPFLPQVKVGEDELKQIFLNLLNNAIDAVEDSRKKQVRIRAAREGERVMVRFEDTGPGFKNLNRAFDPFYTTKPVGKGTGLGLSICYGIAKEFGGEIRLANREPRGAIVLLELPAVPLVGSLVPA
jgi:signal transduction histidine kinase